MPQKNMTIPTVKELILNRHSQHSYPKNRLDPYSLALVIEGGGMRGVVCGAMATALESLGFLNCFDAVYGSSAGAMGGAYLLSGQAAFGTSIYYQDINNNNFIDLKRFLTGKPVLNTSFLLDTVCKKVKPLKVDKILKYDIDFNIVASSLTSKKAFVFKNPATASELMEALRASISVPVAAGKGVIINNEMFTDASVFEPIPIYSALKDQHTHYVVLLTRPKEVYKDQTGTIETMLISLFYSKDYPWIKDYYKTKSKIYKDTIEYITDNQRCCNNSQQILTIQPNRGEKAVSSLEKDHEKLLKGAFGGFAALYSELASQKPFTVAEVIQPFEL